MKKLIKSTIAIIICSFIFSVNLQAKPVHQIHNRADTTIDPKKNPGAIDLAKHPEVLAKVLADVKNGKIAYQSKNTNTDTALNLDKHPEIVKALIKDPAHWPVILKAYDKGNDTVTVTQKNKQVIRNIIADLVNKGIIKDRSDLNFFLLTNSELIVNGKKMEAELHDTLSKKYIKSPGYRIYYGPESFTGEGIFQKSDSL